MFSIHKMQQLFGRYWKGEKVRYGFAVSSIKQCIFISLYHCILYNNKYQSSVYKRERARPLEDISEKSRDMSPWDRAKRRMNYAKGNTESKYTLMAERSYGEAEILDQDHLTNPPSLDDINRKPSAFKDS